jgi:hypothetical protein
MPSSVKISDKLQLLRHVDRAALHAALQALVEDPDRTSIRARIAARGTTLFESDPDRPSRIVAVHPDGTRVPGHLDGRRFVSDVPAARPARPLVHARRRLTKKPAKGTRPGGE